MLAGHDLAGMTSVQMKMVVWLAADQECLRLLVIPYCCLRAVSALQEQRGIAGMTSLQVTTGSTLSG